MQGEHRALAGLGPDIELRRTEYDLERAAAEAEDTPAGTPGRATELARLFAAHRAQLRDAGLVELEGRLAHATRLLEKGKRRPFEHVRAVFVDGFTRFTRAQVRLLTALARGVSEVRVALPDEPTDGREELFSRPRAAGQLLQDALRPAAADVCRVDNGHVSAQARPAGPPPTMSISSTSGNSTCRSSIRLPSWVYSSEALNSNSL